MSFPPSAGLTVSPDQTRLLTSNGQQNRVFDLDHVFSRWESAFNRCSQWSICLGHNNPGAGLANTGRDVALDDDGCGRPVSGWDGSRDSIGQWLRVTVEC
jgi:hypothetical protein